MEKNDRLFRDFASRFGHLSAYFLSDVETYMSSMGDHFCNELVLAGFAYSLRKASKIYPKDDIGPIVRQIRQIDNRKHLVSVLLRGYKVSYQSVKGDEWVWESRGK